MISKIKKFLLLFSLIFLIASMTSFTAFNWSNLSDIQKLLIPSTIMLFGILFFLLLKQEKYKKFALFFACFMIGILFATFGQIYQTGADSWILFRNWAFFLIIPIILSISYVLFSLFLVVTTLMLLFYFALYFQGYQAFHMACLLPAFIVLLYPFMSQKLKIPFHDIFYRSLLIPFYIVFNISGVFISFASTDSYYSNLYNNWLDICFIVSYPLILGLLFLTGYKVYKKTIVLPFSILSAGIFIWSFLSRSFFHGYLYPSVLYYIISLTIFLGTFVVLMKNVPKLEGSFVQKILKSLGNFLKFLIFLFGTGLILSITWIIGLGDFGFLILGVGLLALSCYFPKILYFKEDSLEFISFSIGLFALNCFFVQLLEFQFTELLNFILFLATFNILVFDIFWYLRSSKAMDLLFAFMHYSYIFILCYRLFLTNTSVSPLSFINWIFILGLCILPLQILFERRIKASKNSRSINRIFYGSNLCLLFVTFLFFLNFFGTAGNLGQWHQEYLKILKMILILIISLFVFVSTLKKEEPKHNVRHMVLFSSLLFMISYLASYTKGAEYIILLLLLSIYRQNKWTSYLLHIALCFHIFYYYYSLSTISLAQKSLSLLVISVTLFTSYVIIIYFGKEANPDENETK